MSRTPSLPRALTQRQREVLSFISTKIRSVGYAPSFEEIAKQFGFRSLATVFEHLSNLERKGHIRRFRNEARAIELVNAHGHCPYCGAKQQPQPVETNDGQPESTYAGTGNFA